jgi:membrane-associated phospholipid phosphatase
MSVRIASLRERGLPNGWRDVVRQLTLFAGAYLGYRLIAGRLPAQTTQKCGSSAFHHASQVISLERTLHIFIEPQIQAWAAHSHLLLTIAAYVYLNAQTTLIVGALLYIYFVHNRSYYYVRNMMVVAMAIALLCYAFYPTAPPRFLPEWGFIDTNQMVTGFTSGTAANYFVVQYAAMPSMHIGFAVMLAWPLARLVRPRALKVFWACWPLVITFVTIITGNHFILDAVAGLATAGIAAAVAQRLAAFRPHVWSLAPAASSSPVSTA